MLTVVRHKYGTVAMEAIFILNMPFAFNMPFAIEKYISVSALSSKINRRLL
jgi:hypothetical protein